MTGDDAATGGRPATEFRVSLAALQRSAQVPREDQVEEQAEPDTRPELNVHELPPYAAG